MRESNQLVRVGVDLMGSDSSPEILFEAALETLHSLDSTDSLQLFASDEKAALFQELIKKKGMQSRIECLGTSQEILMTDNPLEAIRRKPHSSLVTGVQFLKENKLDGFVSAGNTGALIAAAALKIPLLPGIDRPALIVTMPSSSGSVAIIDAGGNLTCSEENYVQFAQLGAVFKSCSQDIPCPTVGLLNVGVEPIKGHSELRKAYQHLTEYTQSFVSRGLSPPLDFIGNVEGRDIFQGKVDVVVTDGFTGNVFLKSCEGLADLIFNKFQKVVEEHPHIDKSIEEIQRYFNYTEYPGALVAGLERVVIKCHGNVTHKSMLNCIKGAFVLIKQRFIDQMKKQFHH